MVSVALYSDSEPESPIGVLINAACHHDFQVLPGTEVRHFSTEETQTTTTATVITSTTVRVRFKSEVLLEN